VYALRGVDFEVVAGEVHALVGENGAGKSTLIKIIAGAEQPDEGTITVQGEPVKIGSPQHAFRLGIATVYQEPHVLPELKVVENAFLGRELVDRFGNVDWKRQRKRLRELFSILAIDPRLADERMRHLSVALQQLALIA
jgi:ABC-type sugar transport system ATPase subunit